MTDVPRLLPLVVGVTGHDDIVADAVPLLRARVGAVLTALRDGSGCPVLVASGMATASDLMVAEVACELGMELVAVLPMPADACRTRLAEVGLLDAFERVMARPGVLAVELPDPGAGERAQYEQLGAVLARRSHVLLALWDGQEAWAAANPEQRQGLRGRVGHVVHMAQKGDLNVPGVTQGNIFVHATLRRGSGTSCQVLQIAAPSDAGGGVLTARGEAVAAGDCVPLWGDDRRVLAPAAVWAALEPRFQAAAVAMKGLNTQMEGLDAAEMGRFRRHVGWLGLEDVRLVADAAPGAGVGAGGALAGLARAQAGVDTAAQLHQRLLMGVWVPAEGLRGMWLRARDFMREQGSWWPPVGVLFAFALAVPAAVLGFELYAHALHTPVGLGVYATVLLGGLALYHWRVKPGNWQNRFQDHRALAEALRVQLFVALTGLPVAVPDHYLRRPAGELGWIRLALQGPALWALAVARAVDGPQREVVRQRWFASQKAYFIGADGEPGKMKLNGAAAEFCETWARRWVTVAATLAGALCVIQAVLWLMGCGAHDAGWCHVLGHGAKEWLLVAAATAPAMAAFFVISAEKRLYEAHAHAYGAMGAMFAQALDDTATADEAMFRAVTLETAREALAENAEWLMEHRRRKIDYTPGA